MGSARASIRFHRSAQFVSCVIVLVASLARALDVAPTDLGDLGGDALNPLNSEADAINESGQIAGTSEMPSNGIHVVRWQGGVIQDLGTPTGGTPRVWAMNDAGSIVGDEVHGNSLTRPWIHDGSGFSMLPIPVGSLAGSATAIEPNGKVAGAILNPQLEIVAVSWDPSANPPYAMQAEPSLPPPTFSAIVMIDRLGRIAMGSSVLRNGAVHDLDCSGPPVTRCFVSQMDASGSGKMVGFGMGSSDYQLYWPNLDFFPTVRFRPTYCNHSSSIGFLRDRAVNRLGEIAGTSSCDDPIMSLIGFYWSPTSESQPLLPIQLPSGSSVPYAINSHAQIVGSSSVTASIDHATLWAVERPPIDVLPCPGCNPNPDGVPPFVSYLPNRFINNGIVSRPGFDATQINPSSVTLGDGLGHVTRIASNPDGSPLAEITDLNGDGIPDLKIGFSTTNLIADGVLTPDTLSLELAALLPTGAPFASRYPIVVPEPVGSVMLASGLIGVAGSARRRSSKGRSAVEPARSAPRQRTRAH